MLEKHIERPDVSEWVHPTKRSSRGRCLHPFDEAEMRKCKDYQAIGGVFKCKFISQVDYTTCGREG